MLNKEQASRKIKVLNDIFVGMFSLLDMPEIKASISREHIEKTPGRIAESMFELVEGCWQDPKEELRTMFTEGNYDEIVYVNNISFVSVCAHHFLPFFGKAHFGYLPAGNIVGLSKIPRLIETYSKRPQVQEKLTCEIVDTFNEVLKPKGCGLVMEGIHLCMAIRGVKNESAYSRTTALRGVFKDSSTKGEFLDGVRQISKNIWP